MDIAIFKSGTLAYFVPKSSLLKFKGCYPTAQFEEVGTLSLQELSHPSLHGVFDTIFERGYAVERIEVIARNPSIGELVQQPVPEAATITDAAWRPGLHTHNRRS